MSNNDEQGPRPFTDEELDMWMWGQISVLVRYRLATTGELRESLLRMYECEEAWRRIPHALRNMEQAMPAITQQTRIDAGDYDPSRKRSTRSS